MMFGYKLDMFFVLKNEPKNNILFFHPPDTHIDKQLNIAGLTIGIGSFFDTFSAKTRILSSDIYDYYFHQVKPDNKYIVCCRLKKRMKEIPLNDGSEPNGKGNPKKQKTVKTQRGETPTYMGIEKQRFFPKNTYILRQLKLSSRLYELFYNYEWEDKESLDKFFNLWINIYFLSKHAYILMDFLEAVPTTEIEDGKKWLKIFHFLERYIYESQSFVEDCIVFWNGRMMINREILDQKQIHYGMVYLSILEKKKEMIEESKKEETSITNPNMTEPISEKDEYGDVIAMYPQKGVKKWFYQVKLMKYELVVWIIQSKKMNPSFPKLIFSSLCKPPLVIYKPAILEELNCIRIDYNSSLNSLSYNYNNFFLVYLLNDFLKKENKQKQIIFNLTKNFWFILFRRSNSQFCFIILKEKNISLSQINAKIVKAIKMK